MFTHIPGPWIIEKDVITAASLEYGQSTGQVFIAKIMKHRIGAADHVCPLEIQKANARLVAAAPDLLAALITLTSAAIAATSEDGDISVIDGSLIDAARVAIAKAKGETP